MTGGGGHGGAKSTSAVQIFGNVFISFIGAGVLGLPYAFKEAGFLEGILIMSLVAILSTKAMLMLISCKERIELRISRGGAMHEVWPSPSRHPSHNSPNQQHKVHLSKSNKKCLEEKKQKKKNNEVCCEHETPLMSQNSSCSTVDSAEEATTQSESEFEINIKVPAKKIVYYESFHHLKNKDLDYADVAEFVFSLKGKLIVELSLVVSQTGFCCAYLIFIQENLTDFLPSVEKTTWLVGLLPVLALLCFYRNLNSLSVFSILADLANIFAYLIVFYFDFSQHHTVKKHPNAMSLAGLPFFLGIALYCYEGAGMILSLESSVDPSARHMFKGIFKSVMVIVTTLYISFGAAGYLSFGKDTQPIITLNLPNSVFPHLVKACLCFSLVFTYPMMMFPVVQLLESKFLPEHSQLTATSSSSSSSVPSSRYLSGNVLRCALVCVTGIIVVAIPNFSVLMALVGSTCCTLLAFILPAMFHMNLFHQEMSHRHLVLDYFLVFIGVLGAFLGTWDALCRLFPSLSILGVFNSAKETVLSFTH